LSAITEEETTATKIHLQLENSHIPFTALASETAADK
jgi:hypothetical protein